MKEQEAPPKRVLVMARMATSTKAVATDNSINFLGHLSTSVHSLCRLSRFDEHAHTLQARGSNRTRYKIACVSVNVVLLLPGLWMLSVARAGVQAFVDET